ncbi:hypothetical protein [Streptomyces sp. NPDC087270]|uniref:hypothetical protein n=1 Tax=Streptomyces sp. NPDC087270 TaxID=3365774 RepID=UPI00382E2B5F
MTTSSPLLADIPARPWLTPDTARWAGARAGRWAHPLGPALLLVVGVVAAMANAPDPVCTPQAPCGEQWTDAIITMLFWPQLWWLFVLPEAAVLCGLLLVGCMADPSIWEGGTSLRIADGVVVAGLCWGLAVSVRKLVLRRAQRRRFREAAGGITARAPVLAWTARPKRGAVRWVVGAAMCAAAAALTVSIVQADRADDRAARTAPAVDARVVAFHSGEGTLVVRLPGERRRHHFDVEGDYRNLSTVRVLLPGGGRVLLAAEPYGDRADRQLLALVLGGLGVVAVSSGLVAAGRAARLRRGPVPVLRVLARVRGGSTEVFAHDDTAGAHAVLHYAPHHDPPAPLRQALMFADGAEGGELLLAVRTENGRWYVDASAGPIRIGAEDDPDEDDEDDEDEDEDGAGDGGAATAGDGADDGLTVKERWAAEARVQDALAAMRRPGAALPTRWHASGLSLTGAITMFAVVPAVGFGFLEHSTSWRIVWAAPVALAGLVGPFAVLTWRISAGPAGLRVRRHVVSRQVPWERLVGADYSGGVLTLRLRPAEGPLHAGQFLDSSGAHQDITLDQVGLGRLDVRAGRQPAAERAAAEITAMIRDPSLRPAAASDRPADGR